MKEKEFNLLEEPWIKVSTVSLERKEVSLAEAMLHAQEYADLSGEMPTQDAAVLRVLLAIAQTVFYRYDENGEEDELSGENDADEDAVMERWRDYWDRGSFPETAVREYLGDYSERFWLFHPETPFYQVKDLQYGTDYGAECLVGNMKESNNKATRHHFSMAEGEKLERLDYAEAARWLIYLNAYGVNIKPDKKAPGTTQAVGIGRLGQLGLVMVNGENLFRILMLNLCPLKNGSDLWGMPKPAWEQETCMEQGREIAPPDNLPELYTIQSRRIMLKREDGAVIGFRAIGGDFYTTADDFNEQMTLWREGKTEKKAQNKIYIPRTHSSAVHAWEEFPTLMCMENEGHVPGVVQWMNLLGKEKILFPDTLVTFRMVGTVYGDQMKYTYGDCINDTLMLSAGLLSDFGRGWISAISDEVGKCQAVVRSALSHFAMSMNKLFCGGNKKNGVKDTLVRSYYCLIDNAFRAWLASIDPVKSSREDKLAEWEEKSCRFARQTVEDFIAMRNINIYVHKEEENRMITVPQAMNSYYRELYKIYPKML